MSWLPHQFHLGGHVRPALPAHQGKALHLHRAKQGAALYLCLRARRGEGRDFMSGLPHQAHLGRQAHAALPGQSCGPVQRLMLTRGGRVPRWCRWVLCNDLLNHLPAICRHHNIDLGGAWCAE